MRVLADTFKALADETRLRILALILLRGDLCVCDVEAILGITQSKSSRHMRYLRNVGLVVDRRDGVWLHYRIHPDLDPERAKLLAQLPALLGDETMGDLRARLGGRFATEAEPGSCGATQEIASDAS